MKTDPLISEENVRAALSEMIYSTAPRRAQSLQALRLVIAWASTPTQPPSPHLRWYGLQTILASIITDELVLHRAALALTLPIPNDSYALALVQITQDGQTGNIELISWSWLYYRYVRVDLGIDKTAFTSKAVLGDRTLRRYQQHGIRRLTERLIALEHKARKPES